MFFEKEEKTSIPDHIQDLATQRREAKKNKDYALADSLKKEITDAGWIVKDRKDGFEVARNG